MQTIHTSHVQVKKAYRRQLKTLKYTQLHKSLPVEPSLARLGSSQHQRPASSKPSPVLILPRMPSGKKVPLPLLSPRKMMFKACTKHTCQSCVELDVKSDPLLAAHVPSQISQRAPQGLHSHLTSTCCQDRETRRYMTRLNQR